MKNIVIIFFLLLLLIPIAVQGSREKDIYLDTGGKIGHLTYEESYYSRDSSNNSNDNLTLTESRRYFDGIINNSKITFTIIRPLNLANESYPESMIRAYATLDNITILNTWYGKTEVDLNHSNNQTQNTKSLQLIGFITVMVIFFISIFIVIKVTKKVKSTVTACNKK